jgi:hypothetical protein
MPGDETSFAATAYTSGYGAPKTTENRFSLRLSDPAHVRLSLNSHAAHTIVRDHNGLHDKPV